LGILSRLILWPEKLFYGDGDEIGTHPAFGDRQNYLTVKKGGKEGRKIGERLENIKKPWNNKKTT
jgi:hypothetical protein